MLKKPNEGSVSYRRKLKGKGAKKESVEEFEETDDIEKLTEAGAYWLAKTRKEKAIETKRKNDIADGKLVDRDEATDTIVKILSETWMIIQAFPDTVAPNLHGLTKSKIRARLVKEIDKTGARIKAELEKWQ